MDFGSFLRSHVASISHSASARVDLPLNARMQ